jgi:hypothetical protein
MVMIGIIVIINIDIRDMLVIIIPLGVMVVLNTPPRQSYGDRNKYEIKRESKTKGES